MSKGNFTLPGESGYEDLTLQLAERWGADVIRDSDGTSLSPAILESPYSIYSTICPIRDHNEWIRNNSYARQQTFLCSAPKLARGESLIVHPLNGFFDGQFRMNDAPAAMKYWQVFDRTTGNEVSRDKWSYDPETGDVTIATEPWRQYSVNFLAWRIWEEISMYNHLTNGWDKDRLMQLNPYRPEAQEYLKDWITRWCKAHPHTDVVRFTSLFYNFVWIWGDNVRNRNIFTDWASYDFTVCPEALDDFEKEYGYALCAEDFTRGGKYFATHRVPGKKKRDWMEFISRFVRRAGRELIDIIQSYGKKAYVFYDDNWVGVEPYNGLFEEFGFDGLIKCVFSGYEVRLCAGVPVKTHEIRLHPYLFPVGLDAKPTFSPGGDPGSDAVEYWINVRRALLRAKIERCGLGGYLHLVKEHPGFIEAMDLILKEFREISKLHDSGAPFTLKPSIAVLHTWGKLRTWTLSGHFHETKDHILIHILESLSGLPFDVSFISFDDIGDTVPDDIDVIINAGAAGDAWSGGTCWSDDRVVETLTKWVDNGGIFIGFGEPSALEGGHRFLRMAHVLGVDIDNGDYTCHGRWKYTVDGVPGLIPDGVGINSRNDVMLTGGSTRVLAEASGIPAITLNKFGNGKGIYCAGFKHEAGSSRLLQNLILYATEGDMLPEGISGDPFVECAVYPDAGKLALINNCGSNRKASLVFNGNTYNTKLKPNEFRIVKMQI